VNEVVPLFPDDCSRYYDCWNCGGKPQLRNGYHYVCACGCGWSVRFNIEPKVEAGLRKLRDTQLETQTGIKMVDFTQPGALSSPA
jgi:hypothetical protein